MRAGSVSMSDERQRRAELAESNRLRERALEVVEKTKAVPAKVDRMDRIYRERLVGNRGGGTE